MDYQIILAPDALQDLIDIVSHIAQHNAQAALRLGDELFDVAESLARFPRRGRMVPEFRRPEWREVIYRSYRIIYRVNQAKRRIEVSRFWHSVRGFPTIPFAS
ncbi:MAG TPA: type II toxin-antitoxin system RelE/ParE family toxin [Verrucomicrobiae bacterium]|nr:type II toxin-antitoxin system RelE/ParE family toxin [Verrucomicrobiae bacterium]